MQPNSTTDNVTTQDLINQINHELRKALWPEHLAIWTKFKLQPHKQNPCTQQKGNSTLGKKKKKKEIKLGNLLLDNVESKSAFAAMKWIFLQLKSYRTGPQIIPLASTRGSMSLSCLLLFGNQQNLTVNLDTK